VAAAKTSVSLPLKPKQDPSPDLHAEVTATTSKWLLLSIR
jgi:hypothetical protein